ncbi:MAG: arginine--tRNA ligase [Candidatus Hydrogenedentota bacterium]|jgi:arginyl-tRNA synthetase|uniref:Arginyl tRNA synthetase N-terminal domain-containing protein n=1 Tax=Sumerlaea chitinivorans TaxID=2250252 RepID=A0A2Z4Y3I6_SUMC1|nr:hypothetical protein BRCON_0897 [Candidatus Sumerlaea chitinivorans]RMH24221.1 MAG: arginine--tRNA ligase [Candidatus Hydrogenedentota bacterium]
MQEWGLRGRLKSFLLDAFSQGLGVAIEDVVLERSHSPDFGDYFTTGAITIAPRLERSAAEVACMVAEKLSAKAADWISRAEACENGFVNMFIRYAPAATALLELEGKLHALLLAEPIVPEKALTYVANSTDKRLAVVGDVLRAITPFIRHSSSQPPSRDALTLLRESEEMDLILQLHEFSRIITQKPRSRHSMVGYLYVTSVKFRDGFMWGKRVAPFWLSNSASTPLHEAREFLVTLTCKILLLGISLVGRSDETA